MTTPSLSPLVLAIPGGIVAAGSRCGDTIALIRGASDAIATPDDVHLVEDQAGTRMRVAVMVAGSTYAREIAWHVQGAGAAPASAVQFGGLYPSGTIALAPGACSAWIEIPLLAAAPTTTTIAVVMTMPQGVLPQTQRRLIDIDAGPAWTTLPTITAQDSTPETMEPLAGSDGVLIRGTVVARRWMRFGVPVEGATTSTYAPISGGDYTYQVTAQGSGGTATATSATITVAVAPLTATVAPAVTGTAQVGQTLTCSSGTWSAPDCSYSYSWRRGGAAITGATASTYTLVAGDAGQMIACQITATTGDGGAGEAVLGVPLGGRSGTATSATVGPVATAAPAQPPAQNQPNTISTETGDDMTTESGDKMTQET